MNTRLIPFYGAPVCPVPDNQTVGALLRCGEYIYPRRANNLTWSWSGEIWHRDSNRQIVAYRCDAHPLPPLHDRLNVRTSLPNSKLGANQMWHRADFRRSMLAGNERPLLHGEQPQSGDVGKACDSDIWVAVPAVPLQPARFYKTRRLMPPLARAGAGYQGFPLTTTVVEMQAAEDAAHFRRTQQWITNTGTPPNLPPETRVEYRMRGSLTVHPGTVRSLDWRHLDRTWDITQYRIL